MPPLPMTIESLLPHRKPMLLIDDIIRFDELSAVTRSVATEAWPLVDTNRISGLVLIELVAQTASVNNAWELIKQEGIEGDRRGWIVAVKRARLYVDTIAPGTEIVVATRNGFAFENFREVEGTAHIDDHLAAEITLQVMQAKTGS